MNENIDAKQEHLWCCPACASAFTSTEDLIAHLRREHKPATTRERREVAWWRCPLADCPKHDVWFQDSTFLCAHLQGHVPAVLSESAVPPEAPPPSPRPTRRSVPTTARKVHRRAAEVASEDLGTKDEHVWQCPACAFRAPAAEALAAHVRFVHVDPMFDEETPTSWTCPKEGCASPTRTCVNAEDLALHLDAHARSEPPARALPPRRRRRGRPPMYPQTCKVPGCSGRHVAKGLCWMHYQRERRRLKEERDAAAQRAGRVCPACRKRLRPKKGLSPFTGKVRYRALCNVCAQRRRIEAGSINPAEPLCPICGKRPRLSKGLQRGRPRYRATCAPCARATSVGPPPRWASRP